jgi:molybdenum cofactor cytidylyltransferase
LKFGPLPVAEAEGAILAHSLVANGTRLRKGQRIGREEIDALRAAGVRRVVAAKLSRDDVDENAAARAVADALKISGIVRDGAVTGRVNLHAEASGVLTLDRALVDTINAVTPDITLATLSPFARVQGRTMVATVKIIPLAVSSENLKTVAALCEAREAMTVHPFKSHRVALIQTELPSLKSSVLDKTARVTAERLAQSGSRIVIDRRVPHSASAVARTIRMALGKCDLVILFGASAVTDAYDVIPAAIRAARGAVHRVGMPVDPGNLLVLGEVAGTPVIGAPGCARSPKENGFDWVLDRVLAGLQVSHDDLAGMGVGGLLSEIPTRPQPRDIKDTSRGDVHAVILAAGRSSRMGGPNKLLAQFDEKPLIRLVAERVARSEASGLTVVTGHQQEKIAAALAGLDVELVHNPDFASGLASSLKAGIAAVPDDAAAVLIVLGDMPAVDGVSLDRMIAAFRQGGGAVVRASSAGKRGNPVILPRALFSDIAKLEGDAGARAIIEGTEVIEAEIGEGALLDVDTPEALIAAGGVLQV